MDIDAPPEGWVKRGACPFIGHLCHSASVDGFAAVMGRARIQGIRAADVVAYLNVLITQKVGALGSPEG